MVPGSDTRAGGRPQVDATGTLLAVAGAIGLMYPLVEGSTLGWPGWIWAVLAAGIVLTAAFCRTGAAPRPPLPPSPPGTGDRRSSRARCSRRQASDTRSATPVPA